MSRCGAPLDALAQTLKDVAKRMPSTRRTERGPGFEQARVAALAELSDARDAIGAYLD